MKAYPLADELLRPLHRVAMPRAPRVVAPGGTVHVVVRCNDEGIADFELRISNLRTTDPMAYSWSSCAAYAKGADNRLITFHPTYCGLSPYAAVHQRQYRKLLERSDDPRADACDPRWTTQRAVGSDAFVAPYLRGRPGRPRMAKATSDNRGLTA